MNDAQRWVRYKHSATNYPRGWWCAAEQWAARQSPPLNSKLVTAWERAASTQHRPAARKNGDETAAHHDSDDHDSKEPVRLPTVGSGPARAKLLPLLWPMGDRDFVRREGGRRKTASSARYCPSALCSKPGSTGFWSRLQPRREGPSRGRDLCPTWTSHKQCLGLTMTPRRSQLPAAGAIELLSVG